MKSIFLSILVLLCCTGCGGSASTDDPKLEPPFQLQPYDPVAVKKSNPMKLWVHYMPWFETPATNNGSWGQHWTMATRRPDVIGSNGQREIAAHYYPLIGPYASSDPDVIEYHLLLMKYAGIDGLLIDWYGTRALWDYPANKRNTEALVNALDKVGLQFAIVYEDQTLREGLSAFDKVSQAKADMQYLEANFFIRESYIRIDGHPLLLTFGPQEIKIPADWASVFNTLKTKPLFMPLYAHSSAVNNATYTNAEGEFLWVDATAMATKYNRKKDFPYFIGGAYPGFHDYYKEGGWGDSPLYRIDHQQGTLFRQLLDMSRTEEMQYLQLITWNDFGEGTMIEPTEEFGFTFLTALQTFAGTTYTQAILADIHRLYQLRKQYAGQVERQRQIDQAYYYLVSLQTAKATELIDSLTHLDK